MNKLLSTFKSLFGHSDGRLHPARDWFTIISCFLILLILGIVLNVWLFSLVASGKPLGSVSASSTASSTQTTQQTVTDVQSVFQARAAERVHFQTDYHFVDPSQPGS